MYYRRMVGMSLSLWMLLLMWGRCEADKEIFLFLNKSEPVMNIRNNMVEVMFKVQTTRGYHLRRLPLSLATSRGQLFHRAKLAETDENVEQSEAGRVAGDEEQTVSEGGTALAGSYQFTHGSSTRRAPNCIIVYPHGGNVVFTFTTSSGLKYGSVFDGEHGAKMGNTDDLIEYLDTITRIHFFFRSSTRRAPNCIIVYPHGGNVVFTFTTSSGLKYGSVFDGEHGAKMGNTDDLIEYLDTITVR
ncbi:hypothetical protein DICVIV_07719 [Dictyocaulus viviparus]|uniref:Jacalin-type lectin domain-containing protein n=1 Tax=Dictyocaulus viviparus TaxID=29172 RepID=A0A0D8XNZ8_DICVI|nr:hypothetical protein DICVIV_07719 [Dictyocaulus viviparus]